MRARILCLAAALAVVAVACGGEETPTCSDGKQNGAETDVDCGGGCPPCADGLKCGGGADCQSSACAGGVCLTSLAKPCGAPAECASGFCADGVCCADACAGVCRSCNAAGSAGTCTLAPAGTDPKAQCPDEGAASCEFDGLCDGAGACRIYAAGTQCAAAECVDAITAQPAASCDGAGTCVVPAAVACQPLVCSGGACLQTCTLPGDCAPGYECAGGLCLKQNGGTCSAPAECASDFCADGFCCESACGGTCERCDQSGREGFCDAAPGSTDPDDECATEAVASCGLTGTCSGARACALYPAGTTCAAAVCAANTSNLPDTCNGAGACVDGGTDDCAPYLCSAATGLCPATCATTADCISGHYCSGQGECLAKLGQGTACAADQQCLSAFCTDGVCCNARCDGVCRRCSQPGQVGTCAFVPAETDPEGDCGITRTCVNGQCLLKDTQACTGDTQCAHGHCCSAPPLYIDFYCRNLATDPDYCGDCTQSCSSTGVAQRLCTGGVCTPQCSAGRFNCDGDGADGCEVNLTQTTLDRCPATLATSWDTCGASRCGCGLACCDNGFDTTPAWTTSGNGSQLFLGQVRGLAGCGGVGLCAGDFHHRLTLEVPPDADYDLHVKNADILYGTICAERAASTGVGLGVAEAVNLAWSYNVLAIPIYYVEVVWKAGGSCGNNWTLRVYGASCD